MAAAAWHLECFSQKHQIAIFGVWWGASVSWVCSGSRRLALVVFWGQHVEAAVWHLQYSSQSIASATLLLEGGATVEVPPLFLHMFVVLSVFRSCCR